MRSMLAATPFRASTDAVRTLQIHFEWSEVTATAAWCNHVSLTLALPLSIEAAGALEELLRERLRLPEGHTVFTARRSDEPFAPPLPLLLIHGLVPPDESSLQLTVVVRPFMQLMLPPAKPELQSIPLSALEPRAAGSTEAAAEFLRRLQTFGTVRLRADRALAEATRGTMSPPQSASCHDLLHRPHPRRWSCRHHIPAPASQMRTRQCRPSSPGQQRPSNACTPRAAASGQWGVQRIHQMQGATAGTPAGARTLGASGCSCEYTCSVRTRACGTAYCRTALQSRSCARLASCSERPPSV